ncbi:hypothetical protein R3P38DRAFT_2779222 [Favolaschia claudopus]|uniref:Uncharacterized protein n=1 Tax=Favolaschia claudopus TaxID=2862362 RepID=A0AAW0BBZ9_9AGAR
MLNLALLRVTHIPQALKGTSTIICYLNLNLFRTKVILLTELVDFASKVSSSYRPPNSLLKNVKADLGGEFEAAPDGPNQIAPSSAPVLLDSWEAYIGQIDSQDPAAELIRGLLSLLPASTFVAPVVPDQPVPPPRAEMTNADEEAVVEVITVDDNSNIASVFEPLLVSTPRHIVSGEQLTSSFSKTGLQDACCKASALPLTSKSESHASQRKEFMNYRRAFTEIGSLEGVLAAPADSPHLLPARPCQLLSALQQQQLGEGQNVPVYVMYVYLSHKMFCKNVKLYPGLVMRPRETAAWASGVQNQLI